MSKTASDELGRNPNAIRQESKSLSEPFCSRRYERSDQGKAATHGKEGSRVSGEIFIDQRSLLNSPPSGAKCRISLRSEVA